MITKQNLILMLSLLMLAIPSFAVPTIQHWKTDSGADVYFVPTEGLPILDAQLVFDAGSARDGDNSGVAALTSALLNEGAAGKSAQTLAEQLESVGALLGVATSRDATSISFRSLTDSQTLAVAWEVLKDIVNTPDFPPKDFQREKERTLLGIQRREESPGTLAQLALYKKIFNGHPYANAIQGDEDSVKRIEIADLKRFYQRYYVASNLKVVLVGGISTKQAKEMVNELLLALPSGKKPAAIPCVNDLTVGGSLHKEYASQQTHLLYALPVLKHNDADYFALYVGNHILGGSGFSSRIVKEIREERGLAYSAYSYFHPMAQKGPFLVGLQTRNEKVTEAVEAVKATLATFIKDGPTDEELTASKKNIIGGFALKLDSNKKLLGNVVSIVASGAPLDYLNQYMAKIKAVTTEQIKDAFQRRIDMEKMVMVTVGKTVEKQK